MLVCETAQDSEGPAHIPARRYCVAGRHSPDPGPLSGTPQHIGIGCGDILEPSSLDLKNKVMWLVRLQFEIERQPWPVSAIRGDGTRGTAPPCRELVCCGKPIVVPAMPSISGPASVVGRDKEPGRYRRRMVERGDPSQNDRSVGLPGIGHGLTTLNHAMICHPALTPDESAVLI
jgi:hypothetical protein